VVADRFFPSSKTCSACGWVKAKLTPAERTFCCEGCGLRMDRDLNAAGNLANWARGDEAGSRHRVAPGQDRHRRAQALTART
jgi:putative transposase